MASVDKARLLRARIVEREIPKRILKYLRKAFDKLVLAYSGGSDSTLLLLVCHGNDIPLDAVVFCNTRMEYPETLKYVHTVIPVLGYEKIFHEVYPELSASELGQIIVEDFDKTLYSCKKYDKSDYRCCYYAKEKPMKDFLREKNLDREDVCVLRGFRLVDNSSRMLSGLTLIEVGKFYYYDYKNADRAKTANPLWTVTDEAKDRWLQQLCATYNIPMPQKSGCMICPIYYKYASEQEKSEARFQIAARFIERRSRQKLPHYMEA